MDESCESLVLRKKMERAMYLVILVILVSICMLFLRIGCSPSVKPSSIKVIFSDTGKPARKADVLVVYGARYRFLWPMEHNSGAWGCFWSDFFKTDSDGMLVIPSIPGAARINLNFRQKFSYRLRAYVPTNDLSYMNTNSNYDKTITYHSKDSVALVKSEGLAGKINYMSDLLSDAIFCNRMSKEDKVAFSYRVRGLMHDEADKLLSLFFKSDEYSALGSTEIEEVHGSFWMVLGGSEKERIDRLFKKQKRDQNKKGVRSCPLCQAEAVN